MLPLTICRFIDYNLFRPFWATVFFDSTLLRIDVLGTRTNFCLSIHRTPWMSWMGIYVHMYVPVIKKVPLIFTLQNWSSVHPMLCFLVTFICLLCPSKAHISLCMCVRRVGKEFEEIKCRKVRSCL